MISSKVTTLQQKVANLDDYHLHELVEESLLQVIPADGALHKFTRETNFAIDKGNLSVAGHPHRHVYLPTVTKVLYKEAASRYTELLAGKKVLKRLDIPSEDF